MSCVLSKVLKINEKYDLISFFEKEPSQENFDHFKDLWFSDLMKDYHQKDKLIISANSILSYFGITKTIIDVEYDETDDVLIWGIKNV